MGFATNIARVISSEVGDIFDTKAVAKTINNEVERLFDADKKTMTHSNQAAFALEDYNKGLKQMRSSLMNPTPKYMSTDHI